MSNYTKTTNFTAKDTLASGDSNKIVRGSEFDTEFNAISSAISSKADLASPTFTGTPTAPTQVVGDESTKLATTAYVANKIAAISSGVTSVAAGAGITITGTGSGPYTGNVTITSSGPTLAATQTWTGANTFNDFTAGTHKFNSTSNIGISGSEVRVTVSGAEISRTYQSGTNYKIALGGTTNRGIQYESAVNALGVGYESVNYVQFVGSSYAEFNLADVRKQGGGSFNASSDQRLKTDVADYSKGLTALKSLRPVSYKYIDKKTGATIDRTFIGIIAQEVEQTQFANIVGTDADGYKTVDPSELVFALVNAVKELSTEVNILKTKVANLEAQQ
jgi:hypothetical protein